MVIDSHAHFEPRMLELERVVSKMDAAGVNRIALIPAMNDPLPETPERLLSIVRFLMTRRWGRPLAERVHRSTMTADGNLKLSGKQFGIYAQPDNAAVADVLRARPDRFLGWIFLNPRGNPPLDELEKWRAVPGMIGVKLHPHWHDYDTDLLDPVLRRCEELKLPVLVHLGFGRRGDFVAMTSRFPKVKIIAAHAGIPFYQQLWAHKDRAPNLFVDLSSPYLNEQLARSAVAAMGPERCLYGTDAPYGFHGDDGSYDYGAIKGWIARMKISETQRERILGGNFGELVRM